MFLKKTNQRLDSIDTELKAQRTALESLVDTSSMQVILLRRMNELLQKMAQHSLATRIGTVCFECDNPERCRSAETCYAMHAGFPAKPPSHPTEPSQCAQVSPVSDRELESRNAKTITKPQPRGVAGEVSLDSGEDGKPR